MFKYGKKIVIGFVIFCFSVFLITSFCTRNYKEYTVKDVITPKEILLSSNKIFVINEVDVFEPNYNGHNKELCRRLNISEDEGFLLGIFGRYWAKNIINGRKVKISENNLIYYKFGYLTRLKISPFCIIGAKPSNPLAFNRELNMIRRGKFVILDLDTDKTYKISKDNLSKIKNFIIVRKSHVKNITQEKEEKTVPVQANYSSVYSDSGIILVISDLTTKLAPDRRCSSDICKTILKEINNSKNTIDMAIYGYSETPEIEKALKNAQKRGVKIRLVYDTDSKGNNIYPDTAKFVKLIAQNKSDKDSAEVNKTMHNKFFIFDNKTVITGSANLAHTDMSGFNSNTIIVIKSPEAARYYTDEFNGMFSGKFHNDKISIPDKKTDNIRIYFSPQDKALKNGVLPIIKNAKKHIYISSFIITEKHLTEELINAKNRGIDIKIIVDALNASGQHSKHEELRLAGIPVKAENYAGKMHSKTIVADDEYLVLGSMNFSNSGEHHNDENCIILKNHGAAKFYEEFFKYQWNRIPDKWLKKVPRSEGIDSLGSCSDGLDNNYDGKTDSEDDGCTEYKK